MKGTREKRETEKKERTLLRRLVRVAGHRHVTRLILEGNGEYTVAVAWEGISGEREETLSRFTEHLVLAEAVYRILAENTVMPEHLHDVVADLFLFAKDKTAEKENITLHN